MRLFNQYFLGVLLITIGLVYMARYYLNVNIPVFRTAAGMFLIFFGLSIIFGGGLAINSDDLMLFNSGTVSAKQFKNEYSILFSTGTIDFSNSPTEELPKKITINVIFSNGTIKLGNNLPMVIKANAVFASAQMPDKTTASFGSAVYRTPTAGTDNIEVEANVVFGRLQVTK